MATRIAIVCEYSTVNGGENSMMAAVQALAGEEFEFVFLAPPAGYLETALKRRALSYVPLLLHDSHGIRLNRDTACGRLVQAIRFVAPDIVHANSLSMGRLTGAVAGELGVPCVAHLRDIVGLSRAAVNDLNRNRMLVAVSQATRDFHVAAGLDGDRVRVVHNGIDCELFHPLAGRNLLRDKMEFATSVFIVASIGQVGLRKGQDVLARAAAVIAERLPWVRFVHMGLRHSQKQEAVEFEDAMHEVFRQAGNGLYRLGYCDDVANLLPGADLFVHPARQEPFGRVLLEAAASGVPIVATDVGGTAEMLGNGDWARLVPPDDVTALANAIEEMYHDPELRARYSKLAREGVCRRFGIATAARNLADVWRDVLNDRG